MPYNTAPIPPRREATGTTQLPLSRVKKMIQVDSDIHACSNSAAFVITVATEMFIQYLSEQAHNVVRSEKKPRRNIQYRDLANAVSHHDNLEFLVDIVPKTMPYKEAKKLAANPANASNSKVAKTNGESSNSASNSIEAGQTTLDGVKIPLNGSGSGTGSGSNGIEGIVNGNEEEEDDDDADDPNAQLEKESRRVRLSTGSTISEGQNGGVDVEMK
ncbi:hypothetical protein VTL71DRAFT_13750 [Oculimacula yallundae]|uniref:Transcription factor CBF/NF-Y/archaeal histone domain-containing protein n=1 Tax=Oculimacula yallundae TaxID=86028 RepID=A0ABR4CLU1_9HELO